MSSDPYFNLYYNETQCILEITYESSIQITTASKEWSNFIIPSNLRSSNNISFWNYNGVLFNIGSDGKLRFKSMTGSNFTLSGLWQQVFYSLK